MGVKVQVGTQQQGHVTAKKQQLAKSMWISTGERSEELDIDEGSGVKVCREKDVEKAEK